MSERARIAAGGARLTRGSSSAAEEALGEPECETLLANARRAVQEQARRQGAGTDAFPQPLAQGHVPVEIDDCHASNMAGRKEIAASSLQAQRHAS